MKTAFKVIRPNGLCEDGEVDWPEEPSYDQLKATIEPFLTAERPGARLEHVWILNDTGDGRTSMFVDEESALLKQKINYDATRLYHAATVRGLTPVTKPTEDQIIDGIIIDSPMIHGVAIVFDRPMIHGVAIVFDRPVWA